MTGARTAADRPPPVQRAPGDPRARRSRAALHRALSELLVEQPVERITVVALTERAGLGYATFFRHYSDIEQLLADHSGALVAELTDRVAALGDAPSGPDVARTIVHFTAEHRPQMYALLVGAGAALQREIERHAITAGTRRPWRGDVPAELAGAHASSAVLTVLRWWLADPSVASADRVADLVHRLALAPLTAEPTGQDLRRGSSDAG